MLKENIKNGFWLMLTTYLHLEYVIPLQVLRLESICLVDGSCTSTSLYSECGWTLIHCDVRTELMGTRNIRRRKSPLHMELERFNELWRTCCIVRCGNTLVRIAKS